MDDAAIRLPWVVCAYNRTPTPQLEEGVVGFRVNVKGIFEWDFVSSDLMDL